MGFITHTDADGIISALIFREYNECCFKGFYNLKTFYLTNTLKEEDVAIDLDMNNMRSIGHHINPCFNAKSYNPNNKHLEDLYNQFYSKCPLNTVMLLIKKYNVKIDNLKQLALVLFSDGFFTYYNKYKDNCDYWLKTYDLDYLVDMYNKNKNEVLEIIDKEIVPIFSDTGKYNALKVIIKNGELQNKDTIKRFCEYVINAFGLNVVPSILDKKYNIEENYIVKEIPIHNKEEYIKIKNRINELKEETVSSAMVKKNLIRITMKKDLLIY